MKRIGNLEKRWFFCVLFAALIMNGCCVWNVRQLDKAKDAAGAGNYAAIAEIKVDCDASCDGCNQLHLIKGDACYRLAKQGNDSLKHYTCAVAELSAGIDMTRQWQMESFNLNRPQTYENLSESQRNRRDLLKGAEADAANENLLLTAQRFLQTEPGNACAVYYLNNARYAKMRACLLHPDQCPGLCSDLRAMSSQISAVAATAGSSHCLSNLQELKKEVSAAGGVVNCR